MGGQLRESGRLRSRDDAGGSGETPVSALAAPGAPEPDGLVRPALHPLLEALIERTVEAPVSVRRAEALVVAAVVTLLGLVVLTRPGGDGGTGPAAARAAEAVDPGLVRVAVARRPLIDVHREPEGAVFASLPHPRAAGAPLVFLVEGEWEAWLEVRIPEPPTGTTGWIRAEHVDTSEHRVRIHVDLGEHLLEVARDGRTVLRAPVAVGSKDAPEPGLTFVTERARPANGGTGYGARVLPLAGYANGPDTLFRGDGLVALHEVHDPLALGQDTSRGSLGLAPDDLARLFDLAPLGTPVRVAS